MNVREDYRKSYDAVHSAIQEIKGKTITPNEYFRIAKTVGVREEDANGMAWSMANNGSLEITVDWKLKIL